MMEMNLDGFMDKLEHFMCAAWLQLQNKERMTKVNESSWQITEKWEEEGDHLQY